MRTRNLLLACGLAIILIGVSAAITFSLAQSNDEQNESYEGTDREYVAFDSIDHDTHDIELPTTMTFCGEEVPLDLFYVREQLEREIIVNSYRHSATLLLLKRTTRWFPVMEPLMEKYGLPEDFKYLSMIESELTNAVSPAKAVGFWQFISETGKQYGLEINKEVDMRYNVEKETVAACKYLKDSYRKFGSWTLAAAAYNCGNGRISKVLEEQRVDTAATGVSPRCWKSNASTRITTCSCPRRHNAICSASSPSSSSPRTPRNTATRSATTDGTHPTRPRPSPSRSRFPASWTSPTNKAPTTRC